MSKVEAHIEKLELAAEDTVLGILELAGKQWLVYYHDNHEYYISAIDNPFNETDWNAATAYVANYDIEVKSGEAKYGVFTTYETKAVDALLAA